MCRTDLGSVLGRPVGARESVSKAFQAIVGALFLQDALNMN